MPFVPKSGAGQPSTQQHFTLHMQSAFFARAQKKMIGAPHLHIVHLPYAEPFTSPRGRSAANGSTGRVSDLQLPEGDDLLGMTAHTPAGAPRVSDSFYQGAAEHLHCRHSSPQNGMLCDQACRREMLIPGMIAGREWMQ